MGKNDGSITFVVDIDDKDAQKELAKLKKDAAGTEQEISRMEAKKSPLTEQAEQLSQSIKKAREEAKRYRDQWLAGVPGADKAESAATARAGALEEEYAGVVKQIEKIDEKLLPAYDKLDGMKDRAGELEKQLAGAGKATGKMSPAMERAQKSAQKFQLRLKEVVRSALVFTVISQTLASFREWVGKVLKTNDKAQQSFAKLKGALLTLAQPLVEVIVPALVALSDILTQVAYFFVYLFAALQGKTAQEAADAAKALNEEVDAINGVGTAAKNATKALAGFDEINTLNTSDKSDNVVSPDFSGISELPTWMKELAEGIAVKIRDIRFSWDEAGLPAMEDSWESALIGLLGAVIGAKFLGLTGAIIGLALGISVALISGQFEISENFEWSNDKKDVLGMSALLGGILGAMFLGIKGAMIGIALGLAVSLTSMAFDSENFNANEAKAFLRVALAAVIGIAMGSLLGFGLLGSVIGLMLGLSISLADVAFSKEFEASTRAAARKALFVAVSTIIGALIGAVFGGGVFGGIVGGVIGLTLGLSITLAIDSFETSAVDRAMRQYSSVGSLGIIGSGNSYSLRSTDIPQLATGAVIPPNREFLAVLGDQRSGNNIEAPESLIRKIVREEAGGMNSQLLQEILQAIKESGTIMLDGQKVSKRVVHHINNMTAAAGESVLLL